MGFWSTLGKIGSIAAPIVAAPFTGGASLALIGAASGAAGGALSGGGWKGALTGGAMGAIPGVGGAAKAAGGGMNWNTWGPILAQGAGLVGGAIAGRQATKNAAQRSPEELAALAAMGRTAGDVTGAGKDLLGQSRGLFDKAATLSKEGVNTLQQPINYYQSLLSGNRALMSGAVAPAVAQITGNYRGAGRALEHSGVRGAARDVASADLNRQRVSQIAGLTTGVQDNAAKSLAGMSEMAINAATPLYGAGASLAGTGGSMYHTGANIYNAMLGEGGSNRRYARGEGEKTGQALGAFARDLGQIVWGGKGKGGGGKQPQGAPMRQQPSSWRVPNITASPGITAPSFPGRVSPPILGTSGMSDFDPTQGWASRIRFAT